MVLFAVEVDSSMVVALVAEDVLGCIAHRLEELSASYEKWNQLAGGHELTEARLNSMSEPFLRIWRPNGVPR